MLYNMPNQLDYSQSVIYKICPHDKRKYDCKICSPHLLCSHDKFKRYCKECFAIK